MFLRRAIVQHGRPMFYAARGGRTASQPYMARSFCAQPAETSSTTEEVKDDESLPLPEPVEAGEPQEYSEKINSIVDEITSLNILEVSQLVTALQDKFGFGDLQMMPMGGGGGGGGAAAAEEPEEEKTDFEVKIKAFDAKAKIKIIKEVRAITGLGLKEAKELVESAPCTVKKDVPKEEADELAEKLKGLGAEIELA